MLQIKKYTKKPYDVDGVQVTHENMGEVATWCEGEIQNESTSEDAKTFIKVNVFNAANDRQSQAFVGDWVLKSGNGFKVYTNKAFHNTFQEKTPAAV